MNVFRPLFSTLLAASLATGTQAAETLQLEIISDGHRYSAEQELNESFKSFSSGAIPGATPPQEYQAIRCDGPWGALKYRLTLASGPGFQLQALGNRLLLQIVEHSVISENQTIDAMSVHCIDLKPRQVIKSLVEIELKRGSAKAQQLQLANGYSLTYRYMP